MEYGITVEGLTEGMRYVPIAYNEATFETTTIKRVKELIVSTIIPSVEEQNMRLLYAGKIVKNTDYFNREMTLKDYRIKNRSTLQVVSRVPGGGPGKPTEQTNCATVHINLIKRMQRAAGSYNYYWRANHAHPV